MLLSCNTVNKSFYTEVFSFASSMTVDHNNLHLILHETLLFLSKNNCNLYMYSFNVVETN